MTAGAGVTRTGVYRHVARVTWPPPLTGSTAPLLGGPVEETVERHRCIHPEAPCGRLHRHGMADCRPGAAVVDRHLLDGSGSVDDDRRPVDAVHGGSVVSNIDVDMSPTGAPVHATSAAPVRPV